MANFRVTFPDGSSELVEAHHFVQDGAGLRLYDEDGNQVAGYVDGDYKRCSKATNTVTPAPTPTPAPEEE